MMHITYMFSKKEEGLGLRQLYLRFFADSNIWNVNWKPQNCEADAQEYWASWLLMHSLSFLSWVFETRFQVPNILFEVYGTLWRKM